MALDKKDVQELLEEKQYKRIVEYMLTDKGLNYLTYPVAMFKFHTDKSKRFVSIQKYLPKKIQKYYASFEDTRTPIQETLIECAMLSGKNKEVNVCFTVNEEHKEMIQDYITTPLMTKKKLANRIEFEANGHKMSFECIFSAREYNKLTNHRRIDLKKYKRVTLREILPI